MRTALLLFFPLIFLLSFFTSCKKLVDTDRYVFGQMVDSFWQPAANKQFQLIRTYEKGSFATVNREEIFSITTDASGHFKAKFRAAKKDGIMITDPGVSTYEGYYYFWQKLPTGTEKEINAGVVKAQRRK